MTFRVLYIEDNAYNMQLLRRMLRQTHYELIEAVDGNSGFEMALTRLPDLIITDVGLPDISGIDLIRRIKQTPTLQTIPVIALTADDTDETQKQCMAVGCQHVMYKPVSHFELLEVIRSVSDTAAPVKDAALPEKLPGEPHKKVLIAEDNPDLRAIFARAFDRRYFDVQVAVDGIEALEHLQNDLPDVLILDINMPRMSGIEVLDYLRSHQQQMQVKVIVVSGNPIASHSPEAEYADLFLLKPVDIIDLITFARRLTTATA